MFLILETCRRRKLSRCLPPEGPYIKIMGVLVKTPKKQGYPILWAWLEVFLWAWLEGFFFSPVRAGSH